MPKIDRTKSLLDPLFDPFAHAQGLVRALKQIATPHQTIETLSLAIVAVCIIARENGVSIHDAVEDVIGHIREIAARAQEHGGTITDGALDAED